jgi:hypothetical protein
MTEGLEAAGELVREEWVLPFVISGSINECSDELSMIVERDAIDEFLVPILDQESANQAINVASQVLGL